MTAPEKIPIDRIQCTVNRTYGGEGDIKILAEDLKLNGLINPITVRVPVGDKSLINYEIVAGRRRVAAAKLLGWKDIPARILEGIEVNQADAIAGSENINRLAMHPLDEAAIFARLLEHGETIDSLVNRYDRPASAIWQRIQLLELSDDIKAMFRNGNLSLHSAAMLNSLDAEGQRLFYDKVKDSWQIKKGDELPGYEIIGFISGLNNARLYKWLTDKQCQGCKTRTYFTDKNLFPELSDMNDSCLNHECYIQKWTKLLIHRIKSLKGEHKSHAGAALIRGDSNFRKVLGKTITLDGVEYKILPNNWETNADKEGKNTQPCFNIELATYSEKLEIKPGFYKEPKKDSRAKEESDFAPAVKLMGLPKEEEKAAVKAFEDNKEKLDHWDLGRKVHEKVFWRLMEDRAKKIPTKDEIDPFLKRQIFYRMNEDDKKIFKLVMGKDYSPDQIWSLKDLPVEKLFFLMNAMTFDDGDLPFMRGFEQDAKDNQFLKWVGLTKARVLEMYQEEIRALMPKAGEKTAAGKPGKGKQR